ncbi:hemocyanin G-type, units Oda to Odg [Octopus sinensis]|uniref:Hemocyanin G-type, units Oda to Odg n=1 Tax=Octopus sinensis TaxID=2607531 RepID=A0A6P7SDC4_9MOLL|nr:hemocyanin G-type, units Oda to Odg [Octopus sinensis]
MMKIPCLFAIVFAFWLCGHIAEGNLIRKSVETLTEDEVLNLQVALRAMQDDASPTGYQAIAAYHGEPADCKAPDGSTVVCCLHGMPTFPLWHRLYLVQFEQAMATHGSTLGVPYWDWTQPVDHLPELVSHPLFMDPSSHKAKKNVFYSGDIAFEQKVTARAVDTRLFQSSKGGKNFLLDGILLALEQEDYCHFEVQFEVAHNPIHYLVGGRFAHSMSSLEYTSYDPLFFLHHSNVERLFVIWQALQKHRGLDGSANCGLNMFHKPMEPFGRDTNPISLTKDHAKAVDLFDYNELGYDYDDLHLNGMDIPQLDTLMKEHQQHPRAFANFRLGGIKTSANVRVAVCIPTDDKRHSDNCNNHVGSFFILGGVHEMTWNFGYPFLFEITDVVKSLGVPLDGNYYIHADVTAINGTLLPDGTIPRPTVTYIPAHDFKDADMAPVDKTSLTVRKDLRSLTTEEEHELRVAMERFMDDKSIDGYQALAEFHGLPAKCPEPDAINRVACCVHGMSTFPHWHRLVVMQFEDALIARGSQIGVPYWDWTKPSSELPHLVAAETYEDPYTKEVKPNPFFHAPVEFLHNDVFTKRSVDARLFEKPTKGHHGYLYDGMMLAFEEEDFCDFEVQFEVTHNAIHAWVGGNEPYSMSSLHYTSFDPLFWLHHSQVDRLWAVWQALQIHRGKPYKPYCALSEVHRPLKPFAFEPPLNNNKHTYRHAVPTEVYDYQSDLHYTYDTLFFGGMSVRELQRHIEEDKAKDRVFVGFLLMGIKTSANVDITVDSAGNTYNAGSITILGGSKEMEWRFDRLYKYEITGALAELGVDMRADYSITLQITDINGTALPSTAIPDPIVIFTPGKKESDVVFDELYRSRRDVSSLTHADMNTLRKALQAYEDDKSPNGYQQVAAFHGSTQWCPSPDAAVKYACCHHGMATFPHWHRLLTINFENGLRRNGYQNGIPYWDWTRPISELPALVKEETYLDENGEAHPNPFFSGVIDEAGAQTTRALNPELFVQPPFGEFTPLANEVMYALEQEDFCSFEVQFEIAHNHIHALVGGGEQYSMSSLEYTAYDPLFILHHSNVDRVWAIWQALQKFRGHRYNSANCAIETLRKPMSPFSLTSDINVDSMTREHSVPFDVFDYKKNFHYEYDVLELNGLSIPKLHREINRRRMKGRVFATFMLEGIKQSALVEYYIRAHGATDQVKAGEFYVLGSANEMPWKFDRVYKADITKQMKEAHLHYNDQYHIEYHVKDLAGAEIADVNLEPAIVYEPGLGDFGEVGVWVEPVTSANRIRKNLNSLTTGHIESLRNAFKDMKNDGRYEEIAAFHGLPAQCPNKDGSKVYTCCIHGMPTFPHWHRLYVALVENELLARGSGVAVPYWDWIQPFDHLPALVNEATYYNSRTLHIEPNPFFKGKISFLNSETNRDPQPKLFGNKYLYEHTLFVLEQTDFCEFEVQFEVLHNTIHSWLGGRDPHSMSSLDFTAYDPIFFLHHSNIDRIWAIWQELQRYRKLPYNEANCALPLLNVPMRPFSNTTANHDRITLTHSTPNDVFDYQNVLHYKYDTLSFFDLTITQLEHLIEERKAHDRIFAGFLLHGVKASADVHIYICVPTSKHEENCAHEAGVFSVLGGESEMPWQFDRSFRYEITDQLKLLGLNQNSHFRVKTEVIAVNGSSIHANIFPNPTIIYVPKQGHLADFKHEESNGNLVRKNVERLSLSEMNSLVHALKRMQKDKSSDGFEAIASFHALPPLCPNPTAKHRHACCLHGMATFPHWHRLFVVQFEQALHRHGATVGVPYWDWTRPISEIPAFIASEMYSDPFTKIESHNPFNHGHISFISEDTMTKREVSEYLYEHPVLGKQTWLFDNIALALEQTDYCDFEIQLEIVHNAIHSWIGGKEELSLNHLHYAAYDPLFFLHHSNVDRLWVIWQELQKLRGLSAYESHCALELMKVPLKPFSFGAPYNLNALTTKLSKPEDMFRYKDNFHYEYDILDTNSMSINQIEAYIRHQREHDRVFAGFLLSGFGSSAYATFEICVEEGECHEGSHFAVLGGSTEMPWAFDRLYKIEITDVLANNNLAFDSPFTIKTKIVAQNGTELPAGILPEATVVRIPPAKKDIDVDIPLNHIRRNVDSLDERDIQNLMAALTRVKEDKSDHGFQTIAGYHGSTMCPSPDDPKYACCLHGMPVFPHWHRVYLLHFEDSMRRHGSSVATPYWDWTDKLTKLPRLLGDPDYYDAWTDNVIENPFLRGYIEHEDTYTVRDIRPELFEISGGEGSTLYRQVLLMLEQEDYCDFEVQFEVVHNSIHYLVGGHQKYAMSSLVYSSFDPLFYIHHSMVDRLWAIWQALQEHRKLPYDKAYCALEQLSFPMKPFSWETNPNLHTRAAATPQHLFNYHKLGYKYDNLDFHGMDIDQLEKTIHKRQSTDRVFASFLLFGIKTSADVHLKLCKDTTCEDAGVVFVLGGDNEMPWHFDRTYKMDITHVIHKMHIPLEDLYVHGSTIHLEVVIETVDGKVLDSSSLPAPTMIYVPAKDFEEEERKQVVKGTLMRKNVNSLTPSDIKDLRDALAKVQADSSDNGYQKIASYHGMPLSCHYPNGTAYACCQHGMVTFPHWHRLLVKQMEDALIAHGSHTGIPYWDWTTTFAHLPVLVTEEKNNPFHHAHIDVANKDTTRAPRAQLFDDPEKGDKSFFYRQIALALEQTDFCDFEVQFEIGHNAIHSWVGGSTPYGMSTLHYTSYDPLFYLHHSNTDRIWAVWQALQKYRGLPYNSANCEINKLAKPLKPFNLDSNHNAVTKAHSTGNKAFDYHELGYDYDNLNFHGMTIPELEEHLKEIQHEDRVFAGFLLRTIGQSADVNFDICTKNGECTFGGTFCILGGEHEMFWAFDRLFKYDITSSLNKLRLHAHDDFEIKVTIKAIDGHTLPNKYLTPPTIFFVPAK